MKQVDGHDPCFRVFVRCVVFVLLRTISSDGAFFVPNACRHTCQAKSHLNLSRTVVNSKMATARAKLHDKGWFFSWTFAPVSRATVCLFSAAVSGDQFVDRPHLDPSAAVHHRLHRLPQLQRRQPWHKTNLSDNLVFQMVG